MRALETTSSLPEAHMNEEPDTFDDDYLDDDDYHFSDIDITGITDPDKFNRAMQSIEDYLEKRKLKNTLDDYLY
jgi:hypothetical protein